MHSNCLERRARTQLLGPSQWELLLELLMYFFFFFFLMRQFIYSPLFLGEDSMLYSRSCKVSATRANALCISIMELPSRMSSLFFFSPLLHHLTPFSPKDKAFAQSSDMDFCNSLYWALSTMAINDRNFAALQLRLVIRMGEVRPPLPPLAHSVCRNLVLLKQDKLHVDLNLWRCSTRFLPAALHRRQGSTSRRSSDNLTSAKRLRCACLSIQGAWNI